LAAKGLSGEAVAEAMANLKNSELSRAQEVWRKKFGSPATDPQTRAKHMRFLLTRGFSAEVVRQVVKGELQDESDFGGHHELG
jgi:regulatory protein